MLEIDGGIITFRLKVLWVCSNEHGKKIKGNLLFIPVFILLMSIRGKTTGYFIGTEDIKNSISRTVFVTNFQNGQLYRSLYLLGRTFWDCISCATHHKMCDRRFLTDCLNRDRKFISNLVVLICSHLLLYLLINCVSSTW